MSRGHDYFKGGQIMKILRQQNVRVIVPNDDMDSIRATTILCRSAAHEWYARGINKGIMVNENKSKSADTLLQVSAG